MNPGQNGSRSGSLLITGGLLADGGKQDPKPADLLVGNGRIEAIESPGSISRNGREVLAVEGLIVAPGFIDLHVHLREPGQSHKETIATGTAAAAAGGFTTVCTMPNTTPVNDSPEITRWMRAAERGASVRVHPIAAATIGSSGERLTDFRALAEAGAVGVSDDGRPILGNETMRAALEAARKLSIPVIQHAEDTRMTQGCTMHAGATSFRLGLRGGVPEAEASIVRRDIGLAGTTGGHLHVAHLSTALALHHVRAAREHGMHVTCEVTPHHQIGRAHV